MLLILTKHPGDFSESGLSATVKHFPQKDASSQREILFFFLQGLTFCVCLFACLFVFISVNYENTLAKLK